MATRREFDWAKAEVFYHQGFTAREIAADLGCSVGAVKSRITRDRWAEKKTQIASRMKSVAYQSATQAIRSTAERFVAQMEEDIDRTMLVMQECPPVPDLGMLDKRESVMERLNRRARLTFGLDQESKTSVQIAFFQSPIKPDAQPIDAEVVSPVPAPETGNPT